MIVTFMRALIVLVLLSATGCSIVQDVRRIDALASREVCVLENTAVRPGVLSAVRDELLELGCQEQLLPPSASRTACPVTLSYTARSSWDLATYMSYAHLRVFNAEGHQIGEARYDARRGGGRLDKFITGEDKVRELVGELFAGKCR